MPAIVIHLTIPANKSDEFKTGFYKIYPMPLNELGQPLYTDEVWCKTKGKDLIVDIYRNGKRAIASESAIVDLEIS